MTPSRDVYVSDEIEVGRRDPLGVRDRVNQLRSQGHAVVTDSNRTMLHFLTAEDAESLLTSRDFGAAVALAVLATSGVTEGPLHELWSDLMFGKDGEEHQRIRRAVSSRFTPRAIESIRPDVERFSEDLLSKCGTSEETDLWLAYAVPLPARAACALVGFPDDDATEVAALALRVVRAFGLMAQDAVADTTEAAAELVTYVQELIDSDRVIEGSILDGLLADAEHGLTGSETKALAANLVFGGLDATAKAITSGLLLLLLDHPDAWQALTSDPVAVAVTAAAETLRFFPPVANVARLATQDGECGGTPVPAFTLAAANLDAVCRDPELFDRPDEFDPHRQIGRQYAFGAGQHYCLGANLAKLVLEVAFRDLAARYPRMTLAADSSELPWTADPFRGPVSMPVVLEPSA